MSGLMQSMEYVYLQIGVTGLIIIVGLILLTWYFTKGRKQSEASKIRLAEEYARTGKIIDNCTAVIANNTAIVQANTLQRQDEKHCLENLDTRMQRHGDQLDELLLNQRVCMDRQERK